MTVHLFCGFDPREALGFHVFPSSVLEHATVPVSLHVLGARGMPVGSNDFTYSRFLVPWLMGFSGHAIFADACDMLMQGDVQELDALYDDSLAVQVVQHPPYRTRHPIKYDGTEMECPNRDYARKNWASLMLMNCSHPYWRPLTPQTLASVAGLSLLQLGGLKRELHERGGPEVGALPDAWNRLVDEGQPVEGAKVLHWTAGRPGFSSYCHAPGAELWHAQRARMMQVG
jgi:hypothetical protein